MNSDMVNYELSDLPDMLDRSIDLNYVQTLRSRSLSPQ